MARNPLAPFESDFGTPGGSDPFLSLHREMNRLFDNALRGAGLLAAGAQGQPGAGNFVNASMNVSETDDEIRITAELPGVTEQNIDVSLDDDVLTIRGEKKFERADDKENFRFVERAYGTFQRAAPTLPCRSGAGAGKLREGRAHRDRAQDRATGALAPHPGVGSQLGWSGRSGRPGRVRHHRGGGSQGGQGGAPDSTPGGANS